MPVEIAVDILRGIKDYLDEVKGLLVGGHTIFNPWPLSGGEVTAIAHPNQIVYQRGARPGDVLVLTKPLGTQPAMAVYRTMRDPETCDLVLTVLSKKEAEELVEKAIKFMITPNKAVAEVMQEVKPNAATDVTGFGLVGHAENIAKESNVDIEIQVLPVMKGAIQISEIFSYGLERGEAAETSGGILTTVPSKQAEDFIDALKERKVDGYIIGRVKEGGGKAVISQDVEVVEV